MARVLISALVLVLVGLTALAPEPPIAEDPLPGVTEEELAEIEEDAEEMSEQYPDLTVE